MARKEIDPQFVRYLTRHYRENSNEDLAAHLTVIANADSQDGKKKTVTARMVQSYASRLGLKKSHEYNVRKCRANKMTAKEKHEDTIASYFSGSASTELKVTIYNNTRRIIICQNTKQMNTLRNAAYRYNKKQSQKSGIRIIASTNNNNLTVYLNPEKSCQPYSCRNHISQQENQFAPP